MKLRIKGNTVRYRVSPSEMETLIATGRVEAATHFSPSGPALRYTLIADPATESTICNFDNHQIVISIPRAQVELWAGTDQVGLYAEQPIGPHGSLHISIEKDFACLDGDGARSYEENADTFPNPRAGTVC